MRRLRQVRQQAGFSLTEMMVVVGLMGILAGMAVIQIGASQPSLKGDGAMRVIVGQMKIARDLAVAQRRYMRVTFTAPGTVEISREEVPGPTRTILSTTPLEGGVEFARFADIPDTPDGLGTPGSAAAIDFGPVTAIKFTPDGTLINQNGTATSGTVFLALATSKRSVRAVTVFGPTGRIRAFRWDGLLGGDVTHWKVV